MKIRIILFALYAFSVVALQAQSFEGKIVYQNSYKSRMPNVTDEHFTAMMGPTQEYFYKDGNYKSVTNGTVFKWQLYINKDNKLYSKTSNGETIYWNDGAIGNDELLKAEINKEVITILGNLCDELVLSFKNGVHKYYFCSKFKVDPKLFQNHKFGNWNEVISRTNSLPLKIIADFKMFSVESNAIEIVHMKLDNKQFELPAGAVTQKGPF